MKDIKPCPYCNGEVEVVRVADKITRKEKKNKETGKKEIICETERQFRIQCKRCGALVAKGTKFPDESDKDGKERIAQYDAVIKKQFVRIGSDVWRQSSAAKERDYEARFVEDTDNIPDKE